MASRISMKTIFRSLPLFLLLPVSAFAQARSAEFQITKVTRNMISSPQFTFTGAQQYQANQREMWLEVEVTFNAAPDVTDDLTVKYYIAINNKVLTGEVTHVNVIGGRDRRSVMYIPPRALLRFNDNKPVTSVSIQNIAVQIVQGGAVKDEMSVQRAPAQWYSSIPAISGFVLNKNETPFTSIYWDRYEQIKSSAK